MSDQGLKELKAVLANLQPHHREDLRIAKEIDDGKWPRVTYELKNGNWHNPLSFIVEREDPYATHVWGAVIAGGFGWQIADLVNGHYQNRRGRYRSLRDSLESVIREIEGEQS